MGLFTYYCGCEMLLDSIFIVTLLIISVAGIGFIWGFYYGLNKIEKFKRKKIKFYHKQPCDCDICFNQKEVLK